jgi:V/A-type H+-transporting ATPase subunit K
MRHFDESEENMKMKKWFPWMTKMLLAGALLCGSSALAADVQQAAGTGDQTSVYRTIGLGLAAAFSVGVSILGAGYAVGRIGSAAMGAIAEKPELLPRAILFVALGEGLAILGFAFAMMLLQKM